MQTSDQPNQDPDEQTARALIRAAGLSLSEAETTQLAALYQRLASKRAVLAAVELGETEPLVIVVPQAQPR